MHSKESCSLEFEPSPSSFQRTLQSECKSKEKGIGNNAANLCILLLSCTEAIFPGKICGEEHGRVLMVFVM